MSINLVIENNSYIIDDKINTVESVCIDKSYLLLESKRKIGFFNYKGELLSLIGKKSGTSKNALILIYNNKKFGLIFDDITDEINESKILLSNLIEELIDV